MKRPVRVTSTAKWCGKHLHVTTRITRGGVTKTVTKTITPRRP